MLKCLSAPGDGLHTWLGFSLMYSFTPTSPHKNPLNPLLPGFVLLPPHKLGDSPPTAQGDQRSLNQEPWSCGLCCVPGGKLLPSCGLKSERVGFLPLREIVVTTTTTTPTCHDSSGPSFPEPVPAAGCLPGHRGPLGGVHTDDLCWTSNETNTEGLNFFPKVI